MIPTQYHFLNTIGTLPKLVAASLQYVGLKEYPGLNNSNPVIMNMAQQLGIGDIYPNDEVAWCSLYMCYLYLITGKPQPFKEYMILRALQQRYWGNEVNLNECKLGDVMVFQRPEGGHVGLYIAESKNSYHILGGNQSNSVSFTEIKKERLVSCRNYYSTAAPKSSQKYFIDNLGKVSTNEA